MGVPARRRVAVALLGTALLTSPALAAPRLDARLAAAATGAADELRAALEALDAGGGAASLARAQRAMALVERAVDAYFHAPNLREAAARPAAASLRGLLHGLIGGRSPLLVIHDDVVHFRPALQRDIAAACARLGDRRGQIRHLRAAVAVEGPTLEDLATLRAAHLALGDTHAADAVAAEIAQRRTASNAP
jgi:hypothetical protein